MFGPVSRKSVADTVYEALRDAVFQGTLAAGDALPSERTLCDQFSVGRGVIREALVRLEQAGLIATRHGDTTRVQDYRTNAGLDLLPSIVVRPDGSPNADVLRGALEMRVALAPDVVRCCALRTPNAGQQLVRIITDIEAADDLVVAQPQRALLADAGERLQQHRLPACVQQSAARVRCVRGDAREVGGGGAP